MRIRGYEIVVFWKIVWTYQMNDPLINFSFWDYSGINDFPNCWFCCIAKILACFLYFPLIVFGGYWYFLNLLMDLFTLRNKRYSEKESLKLEDNFWSLSITSSSYIRSYFTVVALLSKKNYFTILHSRKLSYESFFWFRLLKVH